MCTIIRLFLIAVVCCFSRASVAQEWANLEIVFIYDGEKIPERKVLDRPKDLACNVQSFDEALIVNAENKGIQNVAFWLDAKKSKFDAENIHPALMAVPNAPLDLTIKDCVFVPHFLIARVGRTIEVKNLDATGHNVNFNFLINIPAAALIPASAPNRFLLQNAEPAAVPVQCNVHPWMEAKLMVLDHPYGAVSDSNGVLKIANLPAGKKLIFRLFHENQAKSLDEVEVDGKKQTWTKGYNEMEFKAGDNKMKIKINASKFKNK